MGDLSEFQRGQIVGARLCGVSVTAVASVLGVLPGTVSKVMTAYTTHGKTTSGKRNSGRKKSISDRARRVLKRIVTRNRRATAAQVTEELNQHLPQPVSTITVRRELHDMNLRGRVARAKPLIRDQNALARRKWCRDHATWTVDDWKRVLWSDESPFTLFQTTGRVYVWRTPKEAYDLQCLRPTVKHGGGTVMLWAAISWFSLGPVVTLRGRITANDYVAILGDHLHPMVRMLFPDNDAIFQDDNAPILTAGVVAAWFEEHRVEVQHLPWPAQSPDLNIIEHLWSILETRLRRRFPPPSSLTELADALHEEWCNIPLATIHDLYASIPRRIKAVLKAKGGPTPY